MLAACHAAVRIGLFEPCLTEAFVKVTALGFYTEGPHTYLKDNWNILDFVCVMSWVVAQAQVPGVSALQSLKMFRLLRPLKSLSKFQGLRRIVATFMVISSSSSLA